MRRPAVLSLTVAVLTTVCLAGTATAAPGASGSAAAEPPAVAGELLVGYVKGAGASDRERARGRAGAERKERVVAAAADRLEVELVRLPAGKSRAQAEKELESDPAVAYAEPNWIYQHAGKPGPKATPDYFADGRLWGMYGDQAFGGNALTVNVNGSQATEAWTAGNVGEPLPGSPTVYIGVIDEGIQYHHPDLDGQVGNPREIAGTSNVDDDGNGFTDDVHGWDFVRNDNTVYDGGTKGSADDHGTHVSGTIAAKFGEEKGVVGVSRGAKLISGKFLGPNGGSLANAIRAVDYFTDLKKNRGVNVVATSNSWGGGGFSQGLLDAITAGAREGILFIAAAGNSGSDNDSTESYPSNYSTSACPPLRACSVPPGGWATYDAVVAVAAIDKNGAKASFSSYGATTVDLGAPGVEVWSTTAYNTYSSYNGTSMATPHVTGGAALYAASHPDATAAQVKQAILDAAIATVTPSLSGITLTGGRVNVSGF